MKVKKAVIPAAGMGTRVLPASKAIPKEMLPIVDKPAIQYIVEEAVKSGIEDILIIISRGKSAIEDHFDYAPELEQLLSQKGRTEVCEELKALADMANITFIRQKKARGLGDAILHAKSFVGNEPFAVLYGDDVICSEVPVCKQLCDAYTEHEKGVVGMKRVTEEAIQKYSSMAIRPIKDNWFEVYDMIEKPKPDEILSLYSILGRCVLPPSIFEILERTELGAGGELQLTDAMKELARTTGMIGVDFHGRRYDMGNKLGILEAIVEQGAVHPEVGEDFKSYLKGFVNGL